jgi:hypothetical protein
LRRPGQRAGDRLKIVGPFQHKVFDVVGFAMIELAKARLGISRPMIGQSLVLTALTPIALPSTADVAALVCCGKTLASSADAPLQGTNEHKPAARNASARSNR